ncbi:helix-turn-helix domain-containing protein [Streptomyces sp. NPDC091377]|uniref:helix-turn-helix domain-containing protein n=1 Tax=Streptomyces sp. NPDC091377 TaxID=3365995 RepID=UPI0037F40012
MGHDGIASGGNALGDFLRARRAALDPGALGFPDDGRLRRVPGLRREELAQLAHISVDYVVRLEQGRTRRVSRPVLDALAGALRLADDERAHLFTPADTAPSPAPRPPGPTEVAPHLRRLLDGMRDIPAIVLNRRMDVPNAPARRLSGGPAKWAAFCLRWRHEP